MVTLNFISYYISKFHFLHPETKNHHIMHELILHITFTCHRVNIPNSNNIHDEIINRFFVQTI